MSFSLRPYQQKLADEGNASVIAGNRPVLCAPTGAGKSIVIADLARMALERGEKVLVTAHRLEIVKQLMVSLAGHLGQVPQLITRHTTTPLRDVTVAMAPTLQRRPSWIERLQDRTYIIDEAHHIVAPSFHKLLENLNPSHFLGVTATPIRANGGGLKPHFDDLILGPEPSWLMEHGFLAKYKLYGTRVEVDTAGVSTRGGDYALDQLEERVVAINGNILRDWHEHNPEGKPTICVGVSIPHAKSVNDLFNAAGVPSDYVDGTTPQADRDRIFDAFRAGKIKVLCSVCLIDEGVDICEATCLHMLRPTKSLRLYRQLVGRVLRPKADGGEAIIIDAGGSWRELPLPDEHVPWSLEQKIKRVKAENRQVSRDLDDCTVAKRETIVEDLKPLVLIDAKTSFDERRNTMRRRLHKALSLVARDIIPAKALYNHLRDAQYFDATDLLRLQHALNLPDGWAQDHVFLNG